MAAKKTVTHEIPEYAKTVPQVGLEWVFNRLPRRFAITFAANEEAWNPFQYRLVSVDLAKYCYRRGIHNYDPMGLKTVLALVDRQDKNFGVPLEGKEFEQPPKEVLVRSKEAGKLAPENVMEIEVPN